VATRVLAYWNDKESRIELDIDANNRVTAIRWVGGVPAEVVLERGDRSRSYTLPRNTRELPIGTGAGTRLQLTYDAARDRYNGLGGYVRDG
jgi:hypothetical protein